MPIRYCLKPRRRGQAMVAFLVTADQASGRSRKPRFSFNAEGFRSGAKAADGSTQRFFDQCFGRGPRAERESGLADRGIRILGPIAEREQGRDGIAMGAGCAGL